jgi:anti-sigma factor RsiW
LLVAGTGVTLALGALAPHWIDDGSVNDPMTFAKRADVTYSVYAPKWRHPVEVTTTEEEHLISWLS